MNGKGEARNFMLPFGWRHIMSKHFTSSSPEQLCSVRIQKPRNLQECGEPGPANGTPNSTWHGPRLLRRWRLTNIDKRSLKASEPPLLISICVLYSTYRRFSLSSITYAIGVLCTYPSYPYHIMSSQEAIVVPA
jgi:hypothetical protein